MTLRFASLRDAEELVAIYAPIVETTAISFEAAAPDVAEMRLRLAGYAYASAFRGRAAYRFGAEVTVYVAEEARRAGVGRTLYRALLRLLRAQGYRRAFAGIALPNDASVALHHAAGFKFGRWHDVGFYECALGALDVPSHDPLDITALDPSAIREAFAR